MGKFIKGCISIGMCAILGTMLCHGIQAKTKIDETNVSKGFDVSSFNGTVAFDQIAKKGYEYVMLRVGSGSQYTDPNFTFNYGKAGNAGMKRGVYYYTYAKTEKEAEKEAERCLKIVDNRNLECPIAYDIEDESVLKLGKEKVNKLIVAFCEKIKAAGYEPMVYSYASSFQKLINYDNIKNYKIWIASYDVEYPDFPHPYDIWQYKIGNLPGANTGSGECDLNYFYKEFVEAKSLAISETEMNLEMGKTQTASLSATVSPENSSNQLVKWFSSDDKIATVDQNGGVVAVNNGTAVITASTVNSKEATCTVKVTTPATAVEMPEKTVEIGKGEEVQLNPILTPETSTDAVNYESADPKVVRVEKNGKLYGRKKGEVKITATTTSGMKTTFTIRVKSTPYFLSSKAFTKTIKVGETYDMNCKMNKGACSYGTKYSSRNKYKVSVDQHGIVKGVAKGTTLIHAKTYNGKSAWTIVTVE